MSDDFVRDLEAELVAAAQFRAARRRRPLRAGRGVAPLRAVGALLVAVAVVAVVVVAVFALVHGDGDRTADQPPAPPPPPTTATFKLLPLQPLASCGDPARTDLPAAGPVPDIALLQRTQQPPDALAFAPSGLPIEGFDPTATRRAGYGRLRSTVHVIPAQQVAVDGRCDGDDGPGLCLVVDEARFRCFAAADVQGGRAVAVRDDGWAVGVVPDGVARVTLSGNAAPVTVDVVANVYEARLDELPGTQIDVAFGRGGDDGCRRRVAPDLPYRVTALMEPAQPGYPLPRAALDVLNEWMWQLDAIVEDGARFWGGGDGVSFWVVPVVPRGAARCAPATRVCVVAVPERGKADAQCALDGKLEGWRLAPLLPGHAAIYGLVPDRVTGARVTIGSQTAEVDAGLNVIGGVLPFPYRDHPRSKVDLILDPLAPQPRVAVLDAGGDARAIRRRLEDAGYETSAADMTPQERIVVYWRPGEVTREDTARVAGAVDADDRVAVDGVQPIPPEVLDIDAPVAVVVGYG